MKDALDTALETLLHATYSEQARILYTFTQNLGEAAGRCETIDRDTMLTFLREAARGTIVL